MIKVLLKIFQFAACAMMIGGISSAWAGPITYTINGGATSVGGLDTEIAHTTLSNSGEETERSWVESILGGSITFSDKTDISDPISAWIAADGVSDVFVFDLLAAPAYYLVKTGNGGMTDTHFLYQNNESDAYATIDFTSGFLGELVKRNGSFNISKISHVSEFNGATEVSEPGLLALMMVGLMGIAFTRNRRK